MGLGPAATLQIINVFPITQFPLPVVCGRFATLGSIVVELGDLELDPGPTICALPCAARGLESPPQAAALDDTVEPRDTFRPPVCIRSVQVGRSHRGRVLRGGVTRTSSISSSNGRYLELRRLDRRLRNQAQILQIPKVLATQAAQRDLDVIRLGWGMLGPVGQGRSANATERASCFLFEGVLVDAPYLSGCLVWEFGKSGRVVPRQWDADVGRQRVGLGDSWKVNVSRQGCQPRGLRGLIAQLTTYGAIHPC